MARSSNMRRLWALGAAGVLVLAACGGDNSSSTGESSSATTTGSSTGGAATTAAAKKPGWAGELKVAGTEGKTMDPAKINSESGGDIDRPQAIFDTLLRMKKDNTGVGQLAQSMESTDGITWVIKLRPNIKFTDGTPLDAAAVVYNFDRQRDPANAFSGAGTWSDLDSYAVTDPLTVTIKLKSPNGTFWQGFTSYNGLIGSPTAIKADPNGFGSKPIGAGPYMVKEFVRDSYTLLVRNPDYWDPTKPAYETVRVQMYPDPIPRAQALMAHEADLGYSAGQGALNEIGDKADASNLRIEAANGATMVLFNFQKGITKDIRVREAMTLAFDPKRTRDAIRPGNWDSLKLECPPFNPGDFECVEGIWPAADPAKAKQLVADYKASGGSVDVKMLATSSQQADVEYIQQTLNDVGFNVTLNMVQGAEWLSMVNAGEFEISWYAFGYPAANRLVTNMATTGRNLPKHNLLNYDAAVKKARTSVSVADQQAGWKETETIIAQNFMVGYFAPYLDGYIVSKNIDLGDQQRGIRLAYSEVFPTK